MSVWTAPYCTVSRQVSDAEEAQPHTGLPSPMLPTAHSTTRLGKHLLGLVVRCLADAVQPGVLLGLL